MSSSTAIVIGGGVIGLSTAYHLARKKYGRVILLEKGPVGDGSSSRAAGIVTGLLWSETGVRARARSLQLFRELSRELDGYEFQDVGCLNLFDPASWKERELLLPLYDRLGFRYEIMDSDQMNRRFPALKVDEGIIGLLDPLGGYSEPHEYVPALARKVREMGVEIREQQQVTDFLTSNGRVTGVQTAAGPVEGDAVVSTIHAWTIVVLQRLGLAVPFKNFVHQRYVTRPLPEALRFPAVNANPMGGYVRPASGNRLLVGIETAEREEYRVTSPDFHMTALTVDPALKQQIMRDFVGLLPALGRTELETESVGLIAFSMDAEPILGPVDALPGLYVGAAFHSGGFAYNPVAGQLLAEFVADGRTSIDVSAFSPNRFDALEAKKYLETTVRQENAFRYRRRH
jgi:glycine/D-amino acid oxidase-like deaminating enzyme